jgi:Sec-independent protein secretion pathway component TatC
MGLTMLPMIMLYFAGIGLSYVAYAGRGKQADQADQAAAGTS